MPSTRSRASSARLIERLGLARSGPGLIEPARLFTLPASRDAPAQHPLAGLERALEERLGLGVAALGLIELREIVHAWKRIGMLFAQHPLAGLERALIERLGLARNGPGPDRERRDCSRLQAYRDAPGPARAPSLQRALIERLGLAIAALGFIERGQSYAR